MTIEQIKNKLYTNMLEQKREKLIEQIKAKVNEIWATNRFRSDFDVQVELGIADKDGKKNGVQIKITAMYETPGCTFDQLTKLSEYFHTTRIGELYDIDSQGCETCDYGSCYGFVLNIFPEKEVTK